MCAQELAPYLVLLFAEPDPAHFSPAWATDCDVTPYNCKDKAIDRAWLGPLDLTSKHCD